tara:strand:- start:24734 stop:24865 length:132 start_codon:yes stop_codon:yes gene_type:complete
MKITEIKSIVDNIWSCGCGYLISPYKEKCEDCGEIKSNKNINE